MQPVKYASLLARNIRAARAAANLSQTDVSARMQSLGFAAWLRSTVSLAEQGKRRVTAEELLGLALVLETSMVRLAVPAEESPWIELPAGGVIHGSGVRGPGEIRWAGNVPSFMREAAAWTDSVAADPMQTAAILAGRTEAEDG
ncbi:MAG TPA: hypothetical protein VIJ82_21875 [Streptosporangiaceae bacterium]|jgi:transcriptional regulator with XRE-family HTH domain